MLKEFTKKLRERSCSPEEYTKPINPEDFVKYDKDNLWKTSNDIRNQYTPTIEHLGQDTKSGMKTSISPILIKRQKEMENNEYFDPLKKYAQIAEDEGSHIERNPLYNHKLIQNNYFPMSRLVGSYFDKAGKESYFRNRYDKIPFDPFIRESGYSSNIKSHINFKNMIEKNLENGESLPIEDDKQTEYRNIYWRKKGFPFRNGPKPISHTASCLGIKHFS